MGLSLGVKLLQMEADYLNETWLVIRDQEVAHTLIEPAKQRYLEPFMRGELTLQRAADALGVKPNTTLPG